MPSTEKSTARGLAMVAPSDTFAKFTEPASAGAAMVLPAHGSSQNTGCTHWHLAIL